MQARSLLAAFALLTPLAACLDSGPIDDPGDIAAPPVAAAPPITSLTLTLDDGHTIELRENAPGETAIAESGPAGVAPIAASQPGRSLSETYALVRPGEVVPPALVMADARAAALQAMRPPIAPADGSVVTGKGARPIPLTFGENDWFHGAFCNGANLCFSGFNNIWNDYWAAGEFAVTYLGSEATHDATMNAQVCFGGIAGTTGCAWVPARGCGDQIVVPYHWVSCDTHRPYAHVAYGISYSGPGYSTVDMAISYH